MVTVHESCSVPEPHAADWQCCLDPETGCCLVCGVDHSGDPCPECGGIAFHGEGCPNHLGRIG